ncbi:MAG TPA: hypothetical protein VGR06_36355 [Actinophytocola sp.]|jgi:hypothetical protein|uniref:hypothetical protein n=1 Tax=Actinophytocola sp. TaxID=1872138 RepID=UPI002DF82B01|nr:hypothetical protein [Actinophytocola sp.]
MSIKEQLGSITRSLRRSWTGGQTTERVAYVVAAVLFASGLAHLAVLVISGGTWTGPLSLRKPTTFGLSFGLTLASVTWATSFLHLRPRTRAGVLGAFTAASITEVTLVTTQAWRGVPSHFNFETGPDTVITATLAAGGFVIVATVAIWTVTAFRAVADARPSMKLALRFGFVVLLAAMAIGAAMIATGTAARDDPQLAYTTAGFLKPAHAVAMHAILVIPGLAWLLTFTRWPEHRRLRVVQLGVAGYGLLTASVLVESATHVSPLAAPALGTLTSTAGLAAVIMAGAVALYGLLRPVRR